MQLIVARQGISLSAKLAEAQRAGRGMSLYMRDVGSAPRVVLTFDDNSFETQVESHCTGEQGDDGAVSSHTNWITCDSQMVQPECYAARSNPQRKAGAANLWSANKRATP